MNTGEPELPGLYSAERRVLEIQAKLHRWAGDDPRRRFDDLFNLVADPAFLLVAWDRVRGNKGARTAGVDGETARYIEAERGVEGFLERWIFSRALTGSARIAGLMMRWPRCTTSLPAPMSGSWKETSKPASTKFRIRLSWTGCAGASETNVSWPW